MSDRAFQSGMTVGVPAAAMGLALRALLSIILARLLMTEDFGLVGVLLGIVGLATPLWSHLNHQAARVRADAAASAIVRHAVPIGLALGAIVVTTSLAVAEYRSALLATAVLVATEPVTAAQSGLATRTGGKAHALAQATRASMTLPVVAGMALLSTLTATRVMLAYGIGGALYAGALRLARGAQPAVNTQPVPTLRETVVVGYPLFWVSLAAMATHRLDLVMLGFIDGTQIAGSYQTALVLISVPLAVYASALSRYIPSIRTFPPGRPLLQHYSKATLAASMLVIPMVVGVGVWGDVLTELVFGARYRMDLIIYLMLALGMLVHMLAGPNGVTMVALGRDRAMARVAMLQLASNVGLNAFLIPLLGPLGATTATVAAYVVMNTALARGLREVMGGRWHAGKWLRPCLVVLITSVAVSLIVRITVGPTLIGLLFATILLAVIWIASLTHFRQLYRPIAGPQENAANAS